MAIHAAMIDRMDQEVGRVLDQLRKMNAFENTLVIFLSDNGASAEIMVRDDGHAPAAAAGSAQTYLCLGPGWSTTSNTRFDATRLGSTKAALPRRSLCIGRRASPRRVSFAETRAT